VNNTTLLHFLERTVARHFPDMEEFLNELLKPAEAYRGLKTNARRENDADASAVNLQDVKKGLTELRDGLKRIRPELEHFTDMDRNEMYGRQMWTFVTKANSRLEDLVDDVNLADTTFADVINYYGEDDKNMSSSEFYGIFKTFVTSYKVRGALSITSVLEGMTDSHRNVKQKTKLWLKNVWQSRNGREPPKRRKRIAKKHWTPLQHKRTKIPQYSTTSSRNCAMVIV